MPAEPTPQPALPPHVPVLIAGGGPVGLTLAALLSRHGVPSLVIEADEQLLRQTLFNLLLNAIQAVEDGGEIQVIAQKLSPAEALLEVRDTGPGVPAERRTEIFKPYFTTTQKGTGLGLAVVQQIVLAHGWEIECRANEPKGACFSITHLKIVN